MKSSLLCPGLSEIIVCQSKTTLCSSTDTVSAEFILRGWMSDTEDIKPDKRSTEAIKGKMRGKRLVCGFQRRWTKIFAT